MNNLNPSLMARRDRDGMAVIGRSVNAMRGLRFEEGEDDIDANDDNQRVILENDLVSQIATRDAKITELTEAITSRDELIAARDAEIIDWKAKNYDLTLQIPASTDSGDVVEGDDTRVIDYDNDDDLFGED